MSDTDDLHEKTYQTQKLRSQSTSKHQQIPVGKKVEITFDGPTPVVSIAEGQSAVITVADPGMPKSTRVLHAVTNRSKSYERLEWTVADPAVVRLAEPIDQREVTVLAEKPGSTDVTVTFTLRQKSDTATIKVSVQAAVLEVEQRTLDFGVVAVGEEKSIPVKVCNKGDVPLKILNIGFFGDLVGELSVEPRRAEISDEQNLAVVFKPKAGGAKTGGFRLYSNDPNHPDFEVRCNGEGGVAKLKVSPATIDFKGLVLKESKTGNVTVTNEGSAELSVDTITVDGEHKASFTTALTTLLVPAGQSKELAVSFKPGAKGPQAATLKLVAKKAVPEEASVDLAGTGQRPQLVPKPNKQVFKAQLIGSEAKATLQLQNIGEANLDIENISLQSEDFSYTKADGYVDTLAPEKVVELELVCKPGSEGKKTASLVITTTDPLEKTLTVELEGDGQRPKIKLAATTKDFGEANVGKELTATIQVENEGALALELEKPAKTDGVDDFTVVLDPEGPIEKGTPAQLKITFKGAEAGARKATFSLASNDPDDPPTLTLKATATAPELKLEPADELKWEEIEKDAEVEKEVVLKNVGDGTLTIESWELTGEGKDAFTLVDDQAEKELAKNTETKLKLKYKPTEVGDSAAELVVKSDDPDNPEQKLSLSGSCCGWIAFKLVDDQDAIVTTEEFEIELLLPDNSTRTITTVDGEAKVEKLKKGTYKIKTVKTAKPMAVITA